MNDEAQKYIWEGSIPLQIHLHDSEVTIHPSPPPALILAPRIGYLPLLLPQIRPHFSSTLPPGSTGDYSIWFEYKGLPLKWYIPTGVLFDLLCPEPERPWNLTVHFRGYPGNILIPCEGEDSVKWNFINALKEAAYVINGNCKNIMNMSQPDQSDLWRSVLKGNLEAYSKVSSKIKLGIPRDDFMEKLNLDNPLTSPRQGRIPVRLYICSLSEDFNGLEDVPHIDNWDKISYINRSVEYQSEEGKYFTLFDAIKTLLPELFEAESLTTEDISKMDVNDSSVDEMNTRNLADGEEKLHCSSVFTEIKLIRIQGIEPKFEIPFSWVVNNLINPEHFLHICLYVKSSHAKNL